MNTTNPIQRDREKKLECDILISPSINSLGSRFVNSLLVINAPFQQHATSAAPFVASPVKPSRRQLGMTLIEIMIALLIGAFLLTGVLQIFVSSRQTNRMQENLSRLQENGRFAIDFISKDVRRAGYWGCLSSSAPDNDITGVDGGGLDFTSNPDTITLRGAFSPAISACIEPPLPSAVVGCTPPFVITPIACRSPVVITDSYYTDPSSAITYTININNRELRRLTNNQNNGLIEGIENMQILYGADTDADNVPNYYVPAGTAGLNVAQVVSIRISLLAATLEDNLSTQISANGDYRIRRVFNTTIAVRNRLP